MEFLHCKKLLSKFVPEKSSRYEGNTQNKHQAEVKVKRRAFPRLTFRVEDMETQQFNAVLLDISNRLSSDDLIKLKFLVRDEVGKRQQEKVTTGHQLFEILTQRRRLAPDDTGFLSDLLKNIDRHDLSDSLNGTPCSSGPPEDGLDETETAKLNIATEVVAENLGRNWRKLGRRLQVGDVKLESISRRHPTELDETAMELLKEWRRSRGAEARTEDLLRALRDCQFNLTADKVEDKLRAQGYQ